MPGRGKRLWHLTALLLVTSLVMAACGGDDEEAGPQGREVSIAFVGAKTGDAANLGVNIRDGMKLAVDEENAAGGGVTIRMREFDTAGDPAQASTIKGQFIGDQSIVGVVGPAFSGETKALLPDLQQAGVVMISASATNKDLPSVVPDQTVFHRALADDQDQARGIAELIATVEKPRSVAYVHDNSDYGKPLTVDTESAASAKGVRRAMPIEAIDPKAQDYSAAVNKVKTSGADLVFYGGYYNEAGRFKKQLTDAGVSAKFVSGDGSLDRGFIDSAGAQAAEGARLACPYCNFATEDSTGRLKEFYDNYKAKIGKEPGIYSPEAYDVTRILIRGIKAGNDIREKLLRYVEELGPYDGVSKTIEFAPNGNLRAARFFVFQVKDGKIAPLQELTLPSGAAGGPTTTTSSTVRTTTTVRQTTTSSTSSTTSSTSSTTSSSTP